MLAMKSAKYRDWTIHIREFNGGFVAFLSDPSGKPFEGTLICMPSPESAEQYAHKFINWCIKLDERRIKAESSIALSGARHQVGSRSGATSRALGV
jgi:hypothetical protein